MMPTEQQSDARHHQFGGNWTSQKLDVLAGYLESYTTALKDKPSASRPFRKAFIDAFAGSGYRNVLRATDDPTETQSPLFPDLVGAEPQSLLAGSAKLALETEPPFDRYIFIERNAERCARLVELKNEFPERADRIDIQQGDANEKIRDLCNKNWRCHRAVLFLDPYGLQVEWTTVEAVAKTQAIDLWLLFPLGIGVNRLLTRSGDIPDEWRQRLNRLLGTEDWYDEFYSVESARTLFGTDQEQVVKASMASIGRYFNERLRQVFSGVVEEPGVLRNSRNNPLYLLCFAVGNDRGKKLALRIAEHLLRELR